VELAATDPAPDAGGRMTIPADVVQLLRELGLTAAGRADGGARLTGGVSADVWLVDLGDRRVCVKRALERLRVAAEWRAPVSRNRTEREWLTLAGSIVPGSTPAVLGGDAHGFAMEWLDPATHPVWKAELLAGRADPAVAAAVAHTLARIHARTAGDVEVAARFATDDTFAALRLDPYLRATARAHPELGPQLDRLRERTAVTRLALVHGDVSPKNILVGAGGPVFIDAECAWYGDPAFDPAFCTSHLLLKAAHRPALVASYDACARRLTDTWRAGVTWERPAAAEARAATLVPALLLARVDGMSPVEYLAPPARELVRRTAKTLIAAAPEGLAELLDRWRDEVVRG
jgi:hypothetical protein